VSITLQPLIAHDVFVSYGARMVLCSVDLRASPGQRVGLVGENGSGKSTLVRVLAGEQKPDGGTVRRPVDLVHLPGQRVDVWLRVPAEHSDSRKHSRLRFPMRRGR